MCPVQNAWVDAYIIFLLAAEAAMIFPSLNWWPHPIRWFRSLARADKFTLWLALFTALLTFITAVQVWAFIQSERAFLTVAAPQFTGGFAANKELTLIIDVKNSGRSTGFIDKFNTTLKFYPRDKPLPDVPEYEKEQAEIPGPVLPGSDSPLIYLPAGDNQHPRMTLSEAEVDIIKKGMDKMYVFGFAYYRDDFSLPIFGEREIKFLLCL